MNQKDRKQKISWSFGGGVQSWALVAAAKNKMIEWPDVIVFADTLAEHPQTYQFIAKHRHIMGELFKVVAPGDYKTGVQIGLLEDMRQNNKTRIPVKVGKGGYYNRTCTLYWKARRISKFLRTEYPKSPWRTGIGFSLDEVERIKPSRVQWQTFYYPLIDLRLTRAKCAALCLDVLGEIPIKSSCVFCPFHSVLYWRNLQANYPLVYSDVKTLEKEIRMWERDKSLNITRGDGQMLLCESTCWT